MSLPESRHSGQHLRLQYYPEAMSRTIVSFRQMSQRLSCVFNVTFVWCTLVVTRGAYRLSIFGSHRAAVLVSDDGCGFPLLAMGTSLRHVWPYASRWSVVLVTKAEELS